MQGVGGEGGCTGVAQRCPVWVTPRVPGKRAALASRSTAWGEAEAKHPSQVEPSAQASPLGAQ